MNIWINLILNVILGTDATISYYESFEIINQILSALRVTLAILTIFLEVIIYKRVKIPLFTFCLQVVYQMQLIAEIRQSFTSLIPYDFYKYLLLLSYESENNQHHLLQYISLIYFMIELQLSNTKIYQYILSPFIFLLILYLIRQKLLKVRHRYSSSQEALQSYQTVPVEQLSSSKKIDQISKDELVYIMNHSRAGTMYFSQKLEILFMNDKAQKILMTSSYDLAMIQLQKLILQGITQDENLSLKHKEIKSRASQKHLIQKADSKMIESLIASAEKSFKRFESMSEKILDQKIFKQNQKKNQITMQDFKQLLLQLFSDSSISTLLEQRSFIKANKLKVRQTNNFGDKILELHFFRITNILSQGGYMIFFYDVTENEKLQQFIQKYQFQTLHFNSFSHELRTPLNCSLTLLQALKTQNISENYISNYLNPAIVSNKLLMHQINDILDYASFGLGTFQLNVRDFRIRELYDQLEEYYTDICASKNIALTFQIQDNLDSQIIFNDFERILQVLVNLLNNSLKFTKQKDKLIVTAKKKQKTSSIYKDQFIKFIVYDTGRGIAKQELDAINNIIHTTVDNDIYFQLKNFTTKYVGLGFTIGSRMSNELANSKKSYFKIRSNEGVFTKISFRINNQITSFSKRAKESSIKLDQITEEKEIEQNHHDDHHVPIWTTTFFSHRVIQSDNLPQILICDDVPFNLISLNLLIKNLGFQSDTVNDGQLAICQVQLRQNQKQPQYRIIFMDIEMPGLNGYDTTVQLLKIDNKLNIIMCSAYDTEDNLSKALESGMKDFITKPVRIEQLKLLMQKYFR